MKEEERVKASNPAPGYYRHYKGGLYRVIGVARHSESGERLVVYRPCYGDEELWVRPLTMFLEQVSVDGALVPRFTPQGETD